MGADLHIHIYEGITEKDLANFFCHTLGSKYFNLSKRQPENWYKPVSNTPSIWIGEVSWLSAGLSNDRKTYVPDPVGEINELIKKILSALDLENITSYNVTTRDKVESFLIKHKGKKIFTVSW